MVKSESSVEKKKRGRRLTRLSILSGFFSKCNGKELNSEKFADDKSRKLVLGLAKIYSYSLDPIIHLKLHEFLQLKEKNQEKSKKIITEISRDKKNWVILKENFKNSPGWMMSLENILKIKYKGESSKKSKRLEELCSEIFIYLSKKRIKGFVEDFKPSQQDPKRISIDQDQNICCNCETCSDSESNFTISDVLVEDIPEPQESFFREIKKTTVIRTTLN